MKTLHIAGSPRKNGSSNTLSKAFLDRLEEKNGEIESFVLNQMAYQGCQGCYACKTGHERCVLKDDLTSVLDGLFTADLVVLSTPVYFGDVSGQLKCFIDRLFSLAKPDYMTNSNPSRLPGGKQMVFIQSQEAEKELHRDIYEKYSTFFVLAGFSKTYFIRSCGEVTPAEVVSNDNLMRRIDGVASKLII